MKKISLICAAMLSLLIVTGCGNQEKPAQPPMPVNTYNVEVKDTKVASEFTGTIIARNNVPLRAKVTGYVVEKYIHGGDKVVKGQALYRLDGRAYDSALLAAQASAAQANVVADNARIELERYEILAQNDAVAKQVLDAQRTKAEQAKAAYRASAAQVQLAQDNVNDTIIRAPFDGTLGMDDVDLGTFVAAGQTPLVTVQSTSPILVEFSMTENDYLTLINKNGGSTNLDNLQLRLSDGTIYAHTGRVVEISKAVDPASGKIKLKAEFDNSNNVLLPGMFATVITDGDMIKNAMLVPTKALTQILDKYFVLVVNNEGIVRQVAVKPGATVGMFTVVNGDLKSGEQIIVDGLTKVRPEMKVKPNLITEEQLKKGQ